LITLVVALSRLTAPDLKPFAAWLPAAAASGRKDDRIAAIMPGLTPSGLRLLLSWLDELQRLAVAEALYPVSGVFDPEVSIR